ncbi:uncharacterized protein TRIADDRAFT_54205 [Trichoplax adhaerens]|uniref:t-SNARE coiled-coil homology domain-containing protein n=1 Tax=Trichoplax adhaerens TaxID=10228 RepID=B3RRE3_TRIAD|nr:hypothetical protein TRIADDRAFT_54205 [Trichoplax adhaerens]EDV26861.1 hypothetical protein TRIADDRAFT_54205 [Trichoplax adhaerens]|eukprot:XP_002110857.1 hypothetical protein TRIADDRAFT_54205 [Trichoplax adhaerens]
MAMAEDKYSLRVIERSLNAFTEVAIPTNLDRLAKQKENIIKFRDIGDWGRLRREQLHVVNTLNQLKATLKELDKTRCQVKDEDLAKFDQRVKVVKEKAFDSIASFEIIQSDIKREIDEVSEDKTASKRAIHRNTGADDDNGEQIQLSIIEEDRKEIKASWEKLEKNLLEVKELSETYVTMLREQGETIESISDNIDCTQSNLQRGNLSLAQAGKYKYALIPVTGAVVGAAVGGPAVAVYSGIKLLGLAAGVAAGLAGYAGGSLIKNRNQRAIDKTVKKKE